MHGDPRLNLPETPRADAGPPWLLQLALLGLAVFAVCWGSIELPRDFGRVTPIWPANAIALTALILHPTRRWPALLAAAGLGNLAANIVAGDGLLLSPALALCNLFEVTLSGLLLRRLVGERLDLSRGTDLARFFLIAGVIAPLAAALMTVSIMGRFRGDHALSTLAAWAAADGLGALIAVPVLLTLRNLKLHLKETPLKPSAWMSLAILALVSGVVFTSSQPVVFLIPPALLLLVFQLELTGAAFGVVIVVSTAVISGLTNVGPVTQMGISERLLVVQVFLATVVVISFPTAAVLAQRRHALEELKAARAAAEAAAAVKGDFLANMSHELRTPLTSVLGFTRLALEQPDLSAASRGYIDRASTAGAALLATVNDILDFSKLESGQLQVRPEPCDVLKVAHETLDMFSSAADAKGVVLRFEPGEVPPSLAADPNRLRQLLLNLIGNAVKFSEDGDVVLAVSWNPASQRLTMSVTDQGPGIAEAQQSLLFRRFSQVDASSTRRHGGTGLGLAICMGLVEAMGGEIGVESEPGKGSRFFFEIPAPEAAVPESAPEEEGPVFPVGVRVLVADDHAVNRELVRVVLTPFGAVIVEAANGVEAVAQASLAPFDVILMDLRMPEMDGLDAMTAIRQGDGPNRNAPILAFSAGLDGPGAEGRRQAGFDGDLSKPLMPMDLVAAVIRHAGAPEPAAVQETDAA